MSVFYGLSVATSGMFTAQKNLDVINQNVSNTNTPGYSRQVAVQEAFRPQLTYSGSGMMGSGSQIKNVERVRNEYIDQKYWRENSTYGETSAKAQMLTDLETMFGEPSDTGFTTVMNDFMNSLQDLKNDAGSAATRTVVTQRGISFCRYFNSMVNRYEEEQNAINQSVKSTTTEFNALSDQIVRVNQEIFTAELSGQMANELRDKRGLLLDKMSKIADIEVTETSRGMLATGIEDKRLVVRLGGKTFIDNYQYIKLETAEREEPLNQQDMPGLYELKWADGNKVNVNGGKLKGYIDVRDGNEGLNGSPSFKGIPYYISQVDKFVRKFALAFNEGMVDSNGDGTIAAEEDGIGHADGFGLDADGEGPLSTPDGIRFFTMSNGLNSAISTNTFIGEAKSREEIFEKYSQLTAKNISISSDIEDSFNNLAAADKAGEVSNNKLIDKLLDIRNNRRLFDEGTAEDFMKSNISIMAINAQQSIKLEENQKLILKMTENRRSSESGVSIDEELSNMVKHQQAYSASAKMISVWSEIFDILINRTGL